MNTQLIQSYQEIEQLNSQNIEFFASEFQILFKQFKSLLGTNLELIRRFNSTNNQLLVKVSCINDMDMGFKILFFLKAIRISSVDIEYVITFKYYKTYASKRTSKIIIQDTG